jgi:hypothetical protein
VAEQNGVYRVDFGPDFGSAVKAGDFFLTETIKAPDSGVDNDAPDPPEHAHWDGQRLVLSLNADDTQDDTYSTVEVSSTRRFDQGLLDQLLLDGSPRAMVPGRQAVFRNVQYSPNFVDEKAGREALTTGMLFQSWRGIEQGGVDFADRPEFVSAGISYIGGEGLMPTLANRSRRKRSFLATVVDFRVGVMWLNPLPDFDPTEPHDVVLRWELDRDITFVVDGRDVAKYEDGKVRLWPHKLMDKRLRKGVDLLGHRHISVDPCHIDLWLNSTKLTSRPMVPNGLRFTHDYWVALSGIGVEPLA